LPLQPFIMQIERPSEGHSEGFMTSLSSRLLLLAIFLAAPLAAVAESPRKVAMVVGNSAYEATTSLDNTVTDARAVAAALERLGFTVETAYDLTQAGLLEAFGAVSEALEGADAAVFYYAGHGIQIDNENYILPVDVKVESELSIRYGSLSLTDVLRDVERRARVAIVILDACRDNPIASLLADRSTRSTGVARGLAPMLPSGNGTIIAYAAAPGQVASDGEGAHSPYTAALLEEIEQPGVEVGLLFRRVAGRVIDATGGTQRPEILVRLASEYYLAGPSHSPVEDAPALVLDTPEAPPVDVATAPPVPRQAETDVAVRGALGNSGDRAALWDFAATLSESPFDNPAKAWLPPDGARVAEIEPNSSFGTAQPVSPMDELTLAIAPSGDSDWVRIAVQQGGRLTVRAPTTPAEIDLAVRLVNANGDEIAYWVPAPRPGGELLAQFDLARAGAYWLQFADGGNDASAAETFPVTLSYQPEADLYETNDRLDLARHIPLASEFPINILPVGDRDHFKFTAPSPGSLIVNLTDVPESLEGAFRLLDANALELASWATAARPGGDTSAVLDLPRPGVYYLEIADRNGDAADIAPLTFSTRFVPSPDKYEPNDTMATAYAVESTGRHEIAIFPVRDSDWLELAVVQPGELTLEVNAPPSNLDLAFRVLDGNGAEIQYWQVAPRAGGDLFGTYDFARPGRYFLQIGDVSNDASSIEPFTLELAFAASLDAFEPNDNPGSARPLTAGGEVPFTVLPRGDGDWFRISVDQPGELQVMIDEGPQNLDLTYRVVNADLSELAYWVAAYRKGGLTEGSADLPRAGTYYLEVRDANNDERSIEPAVLKTLFTPTLGSNEPNNSFGEATPVDITGETAAHILPIGDADWQVFYAPTAGELDVEIDEVAENLDISFRILDAERTEIQYWINAPRRGGQTTGNVSLPRAGWYFMEIRDAGNDARSPAPFVVRRTFRPAG
jgi:hypothetical protein